MESGWEAEGILLSWLGSQPKEPYWSAFLNSPSHVQGYSGEASVL